MVYLMLDFDGVPHPEGCPRDEQFCRLAALEALLRELPHVRIVVSSMWRLGETLAQLRTHFSADIAARVVGVTPDLFDETADDSAGLRERECEAWIARHDPGAAWVALDDRAEAFDAGCCRLVAVPLHTDGGTGLEAQHLQALAERLRSA